MASKIDTQTIENYLSTIGKKNSKGKIYFGRVLFDIKITKIGIEIILDSPDTQKIVRDFKGEMVKTLKTKFKNSIIVTDKPLPGTNLKVVRLRYTDKGSMKFVDFEIRNYPTTGKSGTLKAEISEPATMLIFNAALESKGKIFKSEEDIL